MALTRQEQRLLVEYGAIFSVRSSHYGEKDEEAYCILVMLYGMFSIDNKSDLKRYRDGILVETSNKFGQSSAFFGRVSSVIADHIVQPAWFSPRESNSDLIKTFKWLLVGATALQLIGVAPVGGAVRRGVEESITTSSVREGINRAKRRLLQGAGSGIIEAIVVKAGSRFPIGAAIVALAIIAYYAMEYKMGKIRETMTERFEAGLATQAELNQISNANFAQIVMESLGEYWK